VENRTVNLAVSTTKLTARTLINSFRAWNQRRKQKHTQKAAKGSTGKQSIKELIGQNQGVKSIPIEKTAVRDFAPILRKYGIDYAVTKDSGTVPPRYLVFFKARDEDAMTAAFTEYSSRRLKAHDKPSLLKQLHKLVEQIKVVPNQERHHEQERDSR